MAVSTKDLEHRIAALEQVIVSLTDLLVRNEAMTNPEVYRMFMTLIRDADQKANSDPQADRISNREYKANAPRAVAIEGLKTSFMSRP